MEILIVKYYEEEMVVKKIKYKSEEKLFKKVKKFLKTDLESLIEQSEDDDSYRDRILLLDSNVKELTLKNISKLMLKSLLAGSTIPDCYFYYGYKFFTPKGKQLFIENLLN